MSQQVFRHNGYCIFFLLKINSISEHFPLIFEKRENVCKEHHGLVVYFKGIMYALKGGTKTMFFFLIPNIVYSQALVEINVRDF